MTYDSHELSHKFNLEGYSKMKKLLLTVALVLAVVTSLVAGTMAAYTQTLDTTSGTATAKTFQLTNTKSTNFDQNLKVAPGGTYAYTVTIRNDGEVDSTITMGATLVDASGKAIKGLVVERISGVSGLLGTVAADGKSVSLTTVGNTTAGVLKAGESATVTFNLKWPYVNDATNNANDMADAGTAASKLRITYNAVGVTDGNVG